MRPQRKAWFRFPSLPWFACLFGAASFAVASQTAVPAAVQAAEVNLYSSRHYEVDDQLYKKFTKETGIKVNVVQAGGSELIQRIQREGRNSPADIFLTADAGVIGQAQQREDRKSTRLNSSH